MYTTQVNLTTGEIVQVPYTPQEQAQYDLNQAAWDAGALNRQADGVRAERNARIAECDWRVLPDVLNGEAWRVYRQALRDVPEQAGFPADVVWPVAP
jgi:hypothetical protein